MSDEKALETAEFCYKIVGPFAYHNYLCAVCREEKAVLNLSTGILGPCWVCHSKGYKIVKLPKWLSWVIK